MTETDFFSGLSAKFGLTYYSSSVCLHATLTTMICYQLVYRRRIRGAIFQHHEAPCRVRVTPHTLWHYILGIIWDRESVRGRPLAGVLSNDGALSIPHLGSTNDAHFRSAGL